jgi:RNA polymerase sigma factor (TIGR02999 family)
MQDSVKAGQITQLLNAAENGDEHARDSLWRLVYGELRAIANAQVAREAGPAHVRPTTLIHEAFIRLSPTGGASFENRRHFFAAAAEAMRRICVDDARKRKRLKRGGGKAAASLEIEPHVMGMDPIEVLAVDEAPAQTGAGRAAPGQDRRAALFWRPHDRRNG